MFSRIFVILVMAAAAGCAERSRPDLVPPQPPGSARLQTIGELKTFEETLGGHATENFLHVSERPAADERCYFTGKLQLPEFYSGLRMVREDEGECTARAPDNDVFFYRIEAVASGQEAISASLADAPVERLFMVVPHEDFHNQAEAGKAPTEVAESAATLVGFLTASGFAKESLGEASSAHRRLDLEAGLFLQKSLIVNRFYDKVSALYAAFRSGTLTEGETSDRKTALFAELKQSCSEISPDPVSFNKCPAAMNNAGLAFDRTYTRNYPMMHDLYELLGHDTPALVSALKRLMANWPGAAADAVELLGAMRVSEAKKE